MKYNIKTKNTFGKSLKGIVLANRDLTKEDCSFLINPTVEYVESPYKIANMKEAVELIVSELDKESVIGLLVDP